MTEARDRYETIPEEMKRLKQWVIWGVNPKKEKCPYTPMNTSVEARANDAAGWADFGAAVSAAARLLKSTSPESLHGHSLNLRS